MAAKAVVRDVGRVLDMPYNFCDQLAKLIPFQPGKLITLKMAREMEPLLAERERKEEEVRELLELAERLEGLTRNVGMHAGGVLIAPGKLTDFCPLYSAEGTTERREPVRQGRRRSRRPGEVRLPRPDHAHHPRLDAALLRQAGGSGGEPPLRSRRHSARRSAGLQDLLHRQRHRGVPVRIARHARSAQERQAGPLRGHHRAGRAVSGRGRWS